MLLKSNATNALLSLFGLLISLGLFQIYYHSANKKHSIKAIIVRAKHILLENGSEMSAPSKVMHIQCNRKGESKNKNSQLIKCSART
jgi:hypothetical protein